MKELKVKITLIEDMLGTASSNPQIQDEFIASKAPDEASANEEVEAIPVSEPVVKGKTVFPRDKEGNLIIWDYQVRGFFKDACSMLKKVDGSESSKCKAFKKEIDGLIFVNPRQIPIQLSGPVGVCQRPLRAQTMQGERVTIATSETVPAGSVIEFTVVCLVDKDIPMVKEWLNYGVLRGLGQWRNSGCGRFTCEISE